MDEKKTEGESAEDKQRRERTEVTEPEEGSSRATIAQRTLSRVHKIKHFIYAVTQNQPRGFGGRGAVQGRSNTAEAPRPPAYYQSAFPRAQEVRPPPMGGIIPGGPMAYFQNPIMDFTYWAPYPPHLPEGIPPGLAHLLSVDCVLVMQQVNMMELFLSIEQTCTFMVLNAEGLCIFYAYETSTPMARYCCGESRPLQIHVKDMYQNEMIYMNRKCSCTKCPCCCQCCCLTAMEVYAMPYTPIGAIIGHSKPSSVVLDIVDVDENVLFHVHQQTGCLCIYCCFQTEFAITTLDSAETEVGLIRKQWGGLFREYLSTADVFTVNFPRDLDVKIKALFLAAMFLINYTFYEG